MKHVDVLNIVRTPGTRDCSDRDPARLSLWNSKISASNKHE